MARPALANIDLNLLIALRVLLEERSVSSAAQMLHISQPAMSKTLKRLRETFDDPLFTRSSEGLIPTPKARLLEKKLVGLLEELETAVFGFGFEPGSAAGELVICSPEMFSLSVLPALVSEVRASAPDLVIRSRNLLDSVREEMATGSVDFSISAEASLGPDFIKTALPPMPTTALLPAHSPLAKAKVLSLEALSQLPRVELFIPTLSGTEAHERLRLYNHTLLDKPPVFETSQLLTALEIMFYENGFLLAPDNVGRCELLSKGVISRPIITDDKEAITLNGLAIIQHRRTIHSPLHSWIRDQLLDYFNNAGTPLPN